MPERILRVARVALSAAVLFANPGHGAAQSAPTDAVAAPEAAQPAIKQRPKVPEGTAITPTAHPLPRRTVTTKQKKAAEAKSVTPAPAPSAPPVSPEPPAPPAPETNPESVGEFEPVLHARNAHIDTCMDTIVAQSGHVIDRPHKAASTWATSAPNDNAFQSLVGLSYPNKQAPNGVAIIFAAPVGPKRCEGQSVQIYPTAQSCASLQVNLLHTGHTVSTLENVPLMEQTDGSRDLLMPTAGGGCVLVSIKLR